MKFSNNAILSLVIIIIIGLLYILVNSNKSREAFIGFPKMPRIPKMLQMPNKKTLKKMVSKTLNNLEDSIQRFINKAMKK